ncbi:MAG: GNAT family N-acetyltransferase [Ferruginibacter sp.]
MEIIIRRAGLDDAETLSGISKQTFFDTFTGTCSVEDMDMFLEAYFSLKQVIRELKNPLDLYYLAEIEGKAVGYLRLMEDYSNLPMMKKWKSLELKRIYVSKEFLGKGVAQQLMDFTLQYAKDNNFQVVWLGVWEHNGRAQKFYEKYGFEHSGHTHDFPIGNTPQTDQWLWKFLK